MVLAFSIISFWYILYKTVGSTEKSGEIMPIPVFFEIHDHSDFQDSPRILPINRVRICALYVISVPEGYFYVGSTGDSYKRLHQHKRELSHGCHPYKELQVVADAGAIIRIDVWKYPDRESAYDAEQKLLDSNRDDEYLLNRATDARRPGLGKSLTEEHKQKLWLANKNRIISDETRLKISKIHKGKTISDEHKEKLSKAHLGKKASEETKKKMSLRHKNRIVSEESRHKLSLSKNVPVIVEGKRYLSYAEASCALGLSYSVLGYRIRSADPKFSNWQRG